MLKRFIALALLHLATQPLLADQEHAESNTIRLSTPKNIPSHWQSEFIAEPIFNSKILVVESGQQHSNSILLVHGLGQNGFKDWLETISALEKNYHIITLDLPGFGHSELAKGRFSPKNYAKVLHWLLQAKKQNKIHIIGHSMGAAVALQFGADYPDFIDSAILVDVAGILQRTAFIKNFAEPPAAMEFVPDQFKDKASRLFHLGDSIMRVINQVPDPSDYLQNNDLLWNLTTRGKPNLNAAYALIETDFSQALKQFNHPSTIIWGTHDRVTPIRTGQLLAHKLNNAQLYTIDGADHIPMKSHTDQFIALIKTALKNPPTDAIPKPFKKPGKENLICNNRNGEHFSGRFNRVIISNCYEIELNHISARTLIIRDSIVHINNSIFRNAETACSVTNSTVIATNTQCDGNTGISLQDGLVDFAGSIINGDEVASYLQGKSQLILSVSEIDSPGYLGNVHGVFLTNPEDKPMTLESMIKTTQ